MGNMLKLHRILTRKYPYATNTVYNEYIQYIQRSTVCIEAINNFVCLLNEESRKISSQETGWKNTFFP